MAKSDPLTQQKLRELAELRRAEANTLFNDHKYDGAYYLCGYAMEMALKYRICCHLQWPEFILYRDTTQVHDFETLLNFTGLRNKITASPVYKSYWGTVKNWKIDVRYGKGGPIKRNRAQRMIKATDALLKELL